MIWNILGIIFLSFISVVSSYDITQASHFTSNIFSYDNLQEAKGLHVRLSGEGWQAENIKETHIKFHQDLFANPTVMKGFADGQVRDHEATKTRCYMSINDRFGQGHPHGMLTVIDPTIEQPFMHIVGGIGDRKGTSEIAYAMLPNYMRKYFGKKVVGTLVNEWAPEVRRIGLGEGLDANVDKNIINAFRCYSDKEGTKELDQLDATASPTNVASWKILDYCKFQAAACDLHSKHIVVDYTQKVLTGVNTKLYESMENDLLEFFSQASNRIQLQPGIRYRMIDTDNNVRTFSKHTRWDRIKYHFEKKVLTLEEK